MKAIKLVIIALLCAIILAGCASANYAYVQNGYTLKVATPDGVVKATTLTKTYTSCVYNYKNYAYVGGLDYTYIYNIVDAAHPKLVRSMPYGMTRYFQKDGKYLAMGGGKRFTQLRIDDPANPQIIISCIMPAQISAITKHTSWALVNIYCTNGVRYVYMWDDGTYPTVGIY